MADRKRPIEERANTSPTEMYAQFRRIVQTWNTGRNPQQVMDLFNEVFGEGELEDFFDDEESMSIFRDIFHFVANMNNLGASDMIIPPTHGEYFTGPELEELMENTEQEQDMDYETDMEGTGIKIAPMYRRAVGDRLFRKKGIHLSLSNYD